MRTQHRTTSIILRPAAIRRWLIWAVIVLTALGALAYVLYVVGDWTSSGALVEVGKRFDMDHEINVPTWFSSSCLLACAAMLATIASAARQGGDRDWRLWAALAVGFVCLSLDEAANMHEIMIVPLRRLLGLGGIFYFAWVLPAMAAVAVVGLSYAGFLRRLEPLTRWRLAYAAAVYLGGALGIELVGGAMADWHGFESLRYITVMMAEEILEMLGLILLLHALLDYIRRHFGALQWHIAPTAAN